MKLRLPRVLLLLVIAATLQVSAEEKTGTKTGQLEPPKAATGELPPEKLFGQALFGEQGQSSCESSEVSQASGGTLPRMLFLTGGGSGGGPLPCAQIDCGCHDKAGCSVDSQCGTCTGTPCFCSSFVSPKRCECP